VAYEGIEQYLGLIVHFSRAWCHGLGASGVARVNTNKEQAGISHCAIDVTPGLKSSIKETNDEYYR
jgi:hypothetical protein